MSETSGRTRRVVAQILPVTVGRGADAKALLRRARPDREWAVDLHRLRNLLGVASRS